MRHNDGTRTVFGSRTGAQEIVAVDSYGKSAVRAPFGLPFCIDWLRDGRLLVVSGRQGVVLLRERDSSRWNEIVVDGRGNIYINGGSGIVLLTPDGSVRQVADNIAFPNGMAITPDNLTLIIAESYGNRRRWRHVEPACLGRPRRRRPGRHLHRC